MAGGHKPKTAALNPFRIFRYAKNTRTGRALQAQSLRSERKSAVKWDDDSENRQKCCLGSIEWDDDRTCKKTGPGGTRSLAV